MCVYVCVGVFSHDRRQESKPRSSEWQWSGWWFQPPKKNFCLLTNQPFVKILGIIFKKMLKNHQLAMPLMPCRQFLCVPGCPSTYPKPLVHCVQHYQGWTPHSDFSTSMWGPKGAQKDRVLPSYPNSWRKKTIFNLIEPTNPNAITR